MSKTIYYECPILKYYYKMRFACSWDYVSDFCIGKIDEITGDEPNVQKIILYGFEGGKIAIEYTPVKKIELEKID